MRIFCVNDLKSKGRFFGGLGRNIPILGAVSLFTDISSEMLYPVVPLFLTSVLGAPMAVIGLIEGAAECTASLLKALSGRYSDRLRRLVPLVIGGYGLSAIGKIFLVFAGSWPLVLFSRLTERIGKGVRTSPRDVLIAASCAPEHRGRAYGLHRTMDTTGAVVGPLVALWLLKYWKVSYSTVFIWAVVPAALGVVVLFMVKEAGRGLRAASTQDAGRTPISVELKKLLIVFGIFSAGNSSDVFLLLRAKDVGFSPVLVVLLYAFYNTVYALAALPAGRLSDIFGRKILLAAGFCIFAAVYAGFAMPNGRYVIWLLFAGYGLYAAATEGIVRAFVADLSTSENRGTAMGLLHSVMGVAAFGASLVAGVLWTRLGPHMPFVYGAVCSLLALFALMFLFPRTEREKSA